MPEPVALRLPPISLSCTGLEFLRNQLHGRLGVTSNNHYRALTCPKSTVKIIACSESNINNVTTQMNNSDMELGCRVLTCHSR